MTIRIAPDLTLPDDVVTQAIAILARRGAGKTHTASVLVEEVVKARLPVVVLDPTGAWWGLRSSADGKRAGLPVVILGGEHGDVPLEASAGKVIADVVVDHPGAYVIDLSGFESKRAETRFSADFLERLYRAKVQRRDPLLVVVDEADTFAPQRPLDDQTRTLGALEAIVRRGRIRGLGVVLISQRAAVLNKNVLTQSEVLVAMQTTGPQDRTAIDDWIKGNGSAEEREAVLSSLASLERGEAWVWSPSWLRTLVRIRIRPRETFDSSKTPEAGAVAIEPRAFAAVDLAALGERIAASVVQAKANDPAELRRRITELERGNRLMADTIANQRPAEAVVERVEVPVLNGQVPELRAAIGELVSAGQRLVEVAAAIGDAAAVIQTTGTSITTAIARVSAPRSAPASTGVPAARAGVATVERAPGRSGAPRIEAIPRTRGIETATTTDPSRQADAGTLPASLGKAERLILAALAQYAQGRTQTQLGLLTGYSHKGGGFNNALSRLRSLGLAEGTRAGIRITEAGRDAVGDVEPLPTGRALVDHWLAQLSKAERLVLEALVDVFPNTLTKEELGERTGYAPTGGGFNNVLSRLRTLELIERGQLRASEDLVG